MWWCCLCPLLLKEGKKGWIWPWSGRVLHSAQLSWLKRGTLWKDPIVPKEVINRSRTNSNTKWALSMRLLRSEWSLYWTFYNWYKHQPALKIVLCWIAPSIYHITKCLLYHQPWENHMDLNNVLMHVWQHCEGWRTDIDDGMQVPLTNYPIISLFNSRTLLWKTISLPKDVYFYQARNELILNFGSDVLGTHVIVMGFYKDDSVLLKSDSHTLAINSGFKAKGKWLVVVNGIFRLFV